jgi:hypothetical protein
MSMEHATPRRIAYNESIGGEYSFEDSLELMNPFYKQTVERRCLRFNNLHSEEGAREEIPLYPFGLLLLTILFRVSTQPQAHQQQRQVRRICTSWNPTHMAKRLLICCQNERNGHADSLDKTFVNYMVDK